MEIVDEIADLFKIMPRNDPYDSLKVVIIQRLENSSENKLPELFNNFALDKLKTAYLDQQQQKTKQKIIKHIKN